MVKKNRGKQQRLNIALVGIVLLAGMGVAYALFTGLSSSTAASGDVQTATRLVTMDGSQVTVPDPNRQATLVFSMAYWCGTCISEARALARLGNEYGDTLRIVMVDIDPLSSPERLQDFLEAVGENNLTWTFDSDGSFSRSYNIRSLETTIIVNSRGVELYRDGYSTPYDVLRSEIEKVIGA